MRKNDKILELFLTELRKNLGTHCKEIILFGSRARGDNEAQSDYDCLVFLDTATPELKNTVDEVAGEFLYSHNALFSVFCIEESKKKDLEYDPFYINARKEGIAV